MFLIKALRDKIVPSNIRTAVGKSFTRRAARRAATMTDGAGTRSYAKALLRLRYSWLISSYASGDFSK